MVRNDRNSDDKAVTVLLRVAALVALSTCSLANCGGGSSGGESASGSSSSGSSNTSSSSSGSSSSGAASNSALSGAYTMVGSQVSGTTSASDTLEQLTLDGNGNFSASSTILTVSGQDGTVATQSDSGTYRLDSSGALTKTDSSGTVLDGGILLADGNAFILTQLSAGSEPAVWAAVKPPQNATLASVQGSYTFVALSGFASLDFLQTLSADNGTFTGTYTENNGSTSTISTGSFPSTPYTVDANGAVTVGTSPNLLTGAVSADGDLIVLTNIQASGSAAMSTISFGVKQGNGVSNSTLSGHYAIVPYYLGFSELTSEDFDANGNWTSTSTANTAGSIMAQSNSGTYTVAADGTLTLALAGHGGVMFNGAVSADGRVLVLADINPNTGLGTNPAIFVAVRQ